MTTSGHELLLSEAAHTVALAPPVAPRITILGEDNRTPLVTIHPDGTLEYGPGYSPDESARRFWEAMRFHMPARCEHCGRTPGQQAD